MRSVPVKKPGHHRGAGVQSKSREPRRRACRNAEKIDEYAFGKQRVVVGENSDGAARGENLQDRPRRLILFDRQIPAQAAVPRDQRIHARHCRSRRARKCSGMPEQRLGEGREFPGAHVPGEKQNSLALAPAPTRNSRSRRAARCARYCPLCSAGNCANSAAIHPSCRTMPRMAARRCFLLHSGNASCKFSARRARAIPAATRTEAPPCARPQISPPGAASRRSSSAAATPPHIPGVPAPGDYSRTGFSLSAVADRLKSKPDRLKPVLLKTPLAMLDSTA